MSRHKRLQDASNPISVASHEKSESSGGRTRYSVPMIKQGMFRSRSPCKGVGIERAPSRKPASALHHDADEYYERLRAAFCVSQLCLAASRGLCHSNGAAQLCSSAIRCIQCISKVIEAAFILEQLRRKDRHGATRITARKRKGSSKEAANQSLLCAQRAELGHIVQNYSRLLCNPCY